MAFLRLGIPCGHGGLHCGGRPQKCHRRRHLILGGRSPRPPICHRRCKNAYIDFIRHGNMGDGRKRMGENTWLRLTEQWTPTAKSVFGFGVQGEVATSTHAGLPWLLYLRKQCKRPLHFWPFDDWEVAGGNSVVAEVYPARCQAVPWSACLRQVTAPAS
jgi:hypothetical protein